MLYWILLDLYTEKVEIILLRRNTDKTILATSHPVKALVLMIKSDDEKLPTDQQQPQPQPQQQNSHNYSWVDTK